MAYFIPRQVLFETANLREQRIKHLFLTRANCPLVIAYWLFSSTVAERQRMR